MKSFKHSTSELSLSEHLSSENSSPSSSSSINYFFPAGSLSSKDSSSKDRASLDTPARPKEDCNIIEYLEYKPLFPQKPSKLQSVSLCASPDLNEPCDPKLSQTHQILAFKQIPASLTHQLANNLLQQSKSLGPNKYKILCENYEKQNKVLRDEVQECTKQISKLMKTQEKQQRKIIAITEEAANGQQILKLIMESIGEMLEEQQEYCGEYSFDFVASQLQLMQARNARRQAMLLKVKAGYDTVVMENRDMKRQISEVSLINSQLVEKLEKKRRKIGQLKRLVGRTEGYTDESESRVGSSMSKSSTPVSDEPSKGRSRNSRTLSVKEPLVGEIDCYREALRDLKHLSERANSKISETRKKLNTIPKGAPKKSGPKSMIYSEVKGSGYIQYYRN